MNYSTGKRYDSEPDYLERVMRNRINTLEGYARNIHDLHWAIEFDIRGGFVATEGRDVMKTRQDLYAADISLIKAYATELIGYDFSEPAV